jgi:hypothetical protein
LVQEVHHPSRVNSVVVEHQGTGAMSCRDTIHLICWYLEGRLSESVETEIKHHLEGCSDCHLVFDAAINTLDRYFSTDRSVGAAITPRAA